MKSLFLFIALFSCMNVLAADKNRCSLWVDDLGNITKSFKELSNQDNISLLKCAQTANNAVGAKPGMDSIIVIYNLKGLDEKNEIVILQSHEKNGNLENLISISKIEDHEVMLHFYL